MNWLKPPAAPCGAPPKSPARQRACTALLYISSATARSSRSSLERSPAFLRWSSKPISACNHYAVKTGVSKKPPFLFVFFSYGVATFIAFRCTRCKFSGKMTTRAADPLKVAAGRKGGLSRRSADPLTMPAVNVSFIYCLRLDHRGMGMAH